MGKSSDQVIEKIFSEKGIRPGGAGELYLPIELLNQFMKVAEENNFAVLGIEGLEINAAEESIMPLPIVGDFSKRPGPWLKYKQACNNEAREFIATVKPMPKMYFAYVVVNEDERQDL